MEYGNANSRWQVKLLSTGREPSRPSSRSTVLLQVGWNCCLSSAFTPIVMSRSLHMLSEAEVEHKMRVGSILGLSARWIADGSFRGILTGHIIPGHVIRLRVAPMLLMPCRKSFLIATVTMGLCLSGLGCNRKKTEQIWICRACGVA